MSYKTVLKSTIISTDDTKKMDLFEKGRLVQSLLSDTFPFGYLMTSATNNSKDYLMTAEDVRLFIDDTIKEVSEQVNSTLDENYTFSSYSIDSIVVDRKRVVISVALITEAIDKVEDVNETEDVDSSSSEIDSSSSEIDSSSDELATV